MKLPSRESTARLQQLKSRVLTSDAPTGAEVRDQIALSWRRSKMWGVSADRLEPPYSEELEMESRLVAAARPVIDHLATMLTGTSMSILLTNARGQIVQRRTGEASLARHLDSIRLAPGFSYAEEHVGTNGIGSAIECRRPFFVLGSEHFANPLAGVSCAGAPIMDPTTGRLQGVLDLTCRAGEANVLMKAMALKAAAEITDGLMELSSAQERALLQEFLIASRASKRAVVAVGPNLYMSNAVAAGILDRADHLLVRDRATELILSGGTGADILLSNGDTASIKARPVRSGDASPGLIVELVVAETWSRRNGPAPAWDPAAPTRAEGPGGPAGTVATTPTQTLGAAPATSRTSGRSGAWAVTQDRVERCRLDGACLVVVGEAGTGKLALIDAAHHRREPSGRMLVLEASTLGTDLGSLRAELARPVDPHVRTIVLRHLDAVPDAAWPAVHEWFERRNDGKEPWVAGTLRADDHESAGAAKVRELAVVVAAPALRHRIEDVRELAPMLLRRLARNPDVQLSSAAMQTLLRHPWPGNVSELETALKASLVRRPRGTIRPEDLPEMVHSTSPRTLSPWDSMERDAVTQALIESKGNKVLAAQRLGISRATLYRKVRAYGIVLSDPGTDD